MTLQVVLLVDNSPIFLHNVRRFLDLYARDQIVVGGAAHDADQGLALAAKLRPDVVLWGIGMPAQPQLQLLPQLRAILPRAGIIVLGMLEEGYREAALAAGADVFLLKDGLPATLLPAISDVSRGRAAE
jgi:DNA-binding NarL/FixJ family response regulator